MEFIKPGTNINFIGNRRIAFGVSGATYPRNHFSSYLERRP